MPDDAAAHIGKVYDALRMHIAHQWPGRAHEEFTWRLGPMYDAHPRFRVRRIDPIDANDGWAYVTLGAWEAGDSAHRTEFLLLSPSETARHVETLAMLAYLHFDPRHRLDVGSDVAIGHPWLEGAVADHAVVCPAYPLPESFEEVSVPGMRITYRWLVPITEQEAVYLRAHGFEALEELFESSGVDLLEPSRPSLVK